MKKQKFCYGRFLSIILSLALLCSALVFPVSVNAATDDEKTAAATALKTAWQEMYAAKGESFMYPNAILKNGAWQDCQGENDKTLLLSDDPHLLLYSDIDLSRYDNSSDVYVGYGKEIHYYNSEKNESHPYCDIRINSSIYQSKKGFYFYVYAENVRENIDLKLNLGWYDQTGTLSPNTVTIPAGTNGYIRFKDTDFFTDGFKSTLGTGGIWTMWIDIRSGFDTGAKLKFGSFQWVNNNTDLGLESLTPNELLVSALKLHTENVYFPEDVERFETALAALKACYDKKELAVLELKAAWEEMETNKAEYGYSEATPRNTSSDEQKDKLGKYYYQIDTGTLVDTNCSAYSNKKLRRWQDNTIDPKWQSINKEGGDGFYFYIYTNEAVNYPINLTMVGSYTAGCNSNADLYYTIPAGTPAGTYIKVSDRDLFTEGHKTLRDKSGDKDSITLFFTSKSDSDISIGALFRYKRAASSTATGIDFVNAANALDISSYGNTEAFTAALVNANAAYEDELTASELKKAFIDMMPTGKSTGYTADTINAMSNDDLLVAATSLHTERVISYDKGKRDKFNAALEAFKAANYTPKEIAKICLNAAYGVLASSVGLYTDYDNEWDESTKNYRKVTNDENDKEYLGSAYFELPVGEAFDKTFSVNPKSNTLTNYDGFYFYIKVKETLTQAFTFKVNTKYSNADADFENICELPAGTIPGYYLFTDKDFYSEGYKTAKTNITDGGKFRMRIFSYSGGNICVGSVYGYKYDVTVPAGSNNWTLEKFANYTVNDIADKNYIISDDFRKLFADAQALGAGVYNGDFAEGGNGFTFVNRKEEGTSGKYYQSYFDANNKKIVVENVGWKPGSMLKNKVVIEPNTEYVLTYRFKASAKTNDIRSGINLVGNNESLDSNKISITVSSNAVLEGGGWAPTYWINGIRHTETDKLVNVAVRFNSGDNDYLNMSMSYQDPCVYTYDYFKLTKVSEIKSGNVNGDSKVDILDLVMLKKFLLDGDTEIAFEAAKVSGSGETVDNDDFNALRKYLLTGTFQ